MSSSDDKLARKGVQLEGVAIAFLVLSWAFIALRIWTRTCVRRNFSWDDSTMMLAGWVIISEATYILTILTVKISLGIFFMRIVVQAWHTKLIYTTIAIATVSSVTTFFYCIFRCGSNVSNYVVNQLKDKCMNRITDRFFAYQHAAVGLLTDCVFVMLPVSLLWKINMERRSKILAGVILSVATLGCICSAIRFRYVDGLTEVHDFFWATTNISIWSTIEPGAGIMAGCAATLRPLLKLAFEKVQSIRFPSTRSSNPGDPHSSDQKNHGSTQRRSRSGTNAEEDVEANRGIIEMQSAICKKNESTDCILPSKAESSIVLCPSRRSGSTVQQE
ncbi:hypothetical protein DM02DRAFT_528532 [Periconia macrospinosa]|uniref:Rhodopsin domain-containing protein n=1 Tax=Periconia macrospinosa TaxID=97972 RepID=A0A2V1DR48_9PLEO|nr:hypothetical protein DM02DRAFT_528532 [Periconia macrospinosa]